MSLSLLGGDVSENFSGRGSTPYEAIRVAYKMVIKEENYVDNCKNSMGENSIHKILKCFTAWIITVN